MEIVCLRYTLIGFLSGSVMYSYLIPKLLLGVDTRESSKDGNPGGMNAMHAAGTGVGLLCILLDLLKAAVPVWAAVTLGGLRGPLLISAAAAPVLGHAFSPFLKFRGGKAISCAFGAMIGLLPVSRALVLLAAAVAFFHFVVVVEPDSLCICVGMSSALVLSLFLEPDPSIRFAFFIIVSVVLFKVLTNPDCEDARVTAVGHVLFRQNSAK